MIFVSLFVWLWKSSAKFLHLAISATMQLLLLLLDIYKLKLCFLYILQMENRGWWHYLTPTPVTAVWRLGRTVWAVLTLLGLAHPHANCHHHDAGDHTDFQSCHLHHNSCQHWNRNTLELVIVVEKYLMYSSLGAIYVKAFTIKLKASNNRTQNFHSGDQCIFEAFSDRNIVFLLLKLINPLWHNKYVPITIIPYWWCYYSCGNSWQIINISAI